MGRFQLGAYAGVDDEVGVESLNDNEIYFDIDQQ
jgi:hypothetical protein